jgi:glutathione synthase/RimK-type ligase-like ATP-grasp enzyme
MAHRLGLQIPQTLITNDPDAFLRFYEECQGKVIYKLLGFPSYEVDGGAIASTFTSLVPEDMLKEAYRIRTTAHLFQEYRPKICDLRVVIIGELLFAIEIHPLSEETRIDFRRDYRALRYAVHDLPEAIQQALFTLTRLYRLQYAAIDLLYTPEKHYLFLELNSVGQLGWLQEPTGLPLFRTLAHFLASKT